MSFDPKDLLKYPYSFGESKEWSVIAKFNCDAFKERVDKLVIVRKVGTWVTILLPEIMGTLKDLEEDESIPFAEIKSDPFLTDEFLSNPERKWLFGCVTLVPSALDGAPVPAPGVITVDVDGTIRINPYLKEYSKDEDSGKLSTLSTTNFFSIHSNTAYTKDKFGVFSTAITFSTSGYDADDNDLVFSKLEGYNN